MYVNALPFCSLAKENCDSITCFRHFCLEDQYHCIKERLIKSQRHVCRLLIVMGVVRTYKANHTEESEQVLNCPVDSPWYQLKVGLFKGFDIWMWFAEESSTRCKRCSFPCSRQLGCPLLALIVDLDFADITLLFLQFVWKLFLPSGQHEQGRQFLAEATRRLPLHAPLASLPSNPSNSSAMKTRAAFSLILVWPRQWVLQNTRVANLIGQSIR